MTVLDENENKYAQKSHILVIDDDLRICELVSRFLHEHGFIVLTAHCADDAAQIMSIFEFDALVVDVMMPKKTGTEFVQELRGQGINVPVLLLTALGEAEDRIAGFECGADDYLPKPFEPLELVLRLNAILRRTQKQYNKTQCYKIGDLVFDPDYDELKRGNDVLRLTSVEANLLRSLVNSVGYVVSRNDLAVNSGLGTGGRAIDVQVTRLRRKIEEDTKQPRYLQTVRGKGYLLRADKI